ncbi:MAG: hypothetical protein SF028_02225 [Candidatus Sumerlaeia bacterium]|nr:hypothetical protein [Candidatus Sumerlaeia bacterium]
MAIKAAREHFTKDEIIDILKRNVSLYKNERDFVEYIANLAAYLAEVSARSEISNLSLDGDLPHPEPDDLTPIPVTGQFNFPGVVPGTPLPAQQPPSPVPGTPPGVQPGGGYYQHAPPTAPAPQRSQPSIPAAYGRGGSYGSAAPPPQFPAQPAASQFPSAAHPPRIPAAVPIGSQPAAPMPATGVYNFSNLAPVRPPAPAPHAQLPGQLPLQQPQQQPTAPLPMAPQGQGAGGYAPQHTPIPMSPGGGGGMRLPGGDNSLPQAVPPSGAIPRQPRVVAPASRFDVEKRALGPQSSRLNDTTGTGYGQAKMNNFTPTPIPPTSRRPDVPMPDRPPIPRANLEEPTQKAAPSLGDPAKTRVYKVIKSYATQSDASGKPSCPVCGSDDVYGRKCNHCGHML